MEELLSEMSKQLEDVKQERDSLLQGGPALKPHTNDDIRQMAEAMADDMAQVLLTKP